MEHVKRSTLGLIVSLALCAIAPGSDINKGYTFAPAEKNVTNTKLNNLVDLASINTTFFTDKSAGMPVTSDVFLYFSASGTIFKKVSLDALLYSNPVLITGQVEKVIPAAGDFLLLYDASAGAYKKVSVAQLVTGTNFISNLVLIDKTNLTLNALVPILNWGTNGATAFTNFLAIWLQSIRTNTLPQSFASTNINIVGTTYPSNIINTAHGLLGTPQLIRTVLVCVTNDAATAYVTGDEIGDVPSLPTALLSDSANSTNVIITQNHAFGNFINKTNGTSVGPSSLLNFRLKVYATFFP